MDKPSIPSEPTQEQLENVVEQITPPLSAAYIDSVRITPERFWNTVLKNYKQQGGPSEH